MAPSSQEWEPPQNPGRFMDLWDDEEPLPALQPLLRELPPLPSVLRYYDDFDDKVRTLNDFSSENVFELFSNGSRLTLDLSTFAPLHLFVIKNLIVRLFSRELSVITIQKAVVGLRDIGRQTLSEILNSSPGTVRRSWANLSARRDVKPGAFGAVKALLHFLADCGCGGWSDSYHDFIQTALPLPTLDKYAAIRTGDVFLSLAEEAEIVRYLDRISVVARREPGEVGSRTLESACMLLCAYLFGMRPVQIALLAMSDVRIWSESETPAVHLTFKMVKQRSKSKALPLTRRVKQEWSPLFTLLFSRATSQGRFGSHRLFSISSAQQVSVEIIGIASRLSGRETSATDLRHTAAQRLVDAGASQEEVAEFLGHSDITTCLVYFSTSPNQAERVNKALGLSAVYSRVSKIAHAKFISQSELEQLKGTQQIAGAPHGLPISGIGGCTTGQSSCEYNPITSCYGCHKFMPVSDSELHRRVLADMRSVVNQFSGSSHFESDSPAYLQLTRTISSIQRVILELEERPRA